MGSSTHYDPSFAISTGFNNHVWSVALQADGRVLAGGEFTTYQGKAANRLARLTADGRRDKSFVIGKGFNGEVSSVAVQADGRIVVGGVFTAYQGKPANHLVRLNANGSRDEGFVIGSGFNTDVQYVTVQANGQILVGGDFTTYQGKVAKSLIRLHTNGSRDVSFAVSP